MLEIVRHQISFDCLKNPKWIQTVTESEKCQKSPKFTTVTIFTPKIINNPNSKLAKLTIFAHMTKPQIPPQCVSRTQ